MRHIYQGGMLAVALLLLSTGARAQGAVGWDITGGTVWEERTGPGVYVGLGGADCTGDHCGKRWQTSLLGSFEGAVGFSWRLIPNVAVFVDVLAAYVHTGAAEFRTYDVSSDTGVLFQALVGGEFHAPIVGWLDGYAGLGIGFAYLGMSAELDPGNIDVSSSYKGLDFEIRLGADIYPFSQLNTLSVGPYFRLGMPYWVSACYDVAEARVMGAGQGADDEQCGGDFDKLDDGTNDFWRFQETPFLVHLGLMGRYGF